MANRIRESIARTQQLIADQKASGAVNDDSCAELNKTLDLTFAEHAKFQELKSRAQVEGIISLEEAQTVYNYLGESPSVFNDQQLHVKVALTKLLDELLRLYISRRKRALSST